MITPKSGEFRLWECSYRHLGKAWSLELWATSYEDAKERLNQIYFGKVEGMIYGKVPYRLGWFAKFYCWIRNLCG